MIDQGHLGFIISNIGNGDLRVPERRCFAMVDSDLRRLFTGAVIFLSVRCSISALSLPRNIQRTRAVQAQVLPVASRCRQSPLLAQLLHQETRESTRTLVRPSLHRALHRHIGHHGLGLGFASTPRDRVRDRVQVGGFHKKSWRSSL